MKIKTIASACLQGAFMVALVAPAAFAAEVVTTTGFDNRMDRPVLGVDEVDEVIVPVDRRTVNEVRRAEERAVREERRDERRIERAEDRAERDANRESIGDYIEDAMVTASVKAHLLGQKGIDSLDIHVETNDGVVTLTGEVDESAQIPLAERTAMEADGARAVVNRLVLKR